MKAHVRTCMRPPIGRRRRFESVHHVIIGMQKLGINPSLWRINNRFRSRIVSINASRRGKITRRRRNNVEPLKTGWDRPVQPWVTRRDRVAAKVA